MDFVSKERWRFVRDIYPEFQHIDSLFPKEEDRAKIARNPYAILNPALLDYRYEANFVVENMQLYRGGFYLRNVFKINRREFFLVKEHETAKNKSLPDTLSWWNYPLNLFVAEADVFIVYYCPPRNDIRMLGGWAYLQPFPKEAFKPRDFEDLYSTSNAITQIRLGEAISSDWYVDNWGIPDSLRKSHKEGGTYYHLVMKKLHTGPAYPRPDCYLAVAGPIPYITEKWGIQTDTGRPPYKIENPEFEPWTRIEISHFATNPVEPHPKGFPGYEVRYIIKRNPESPQDLLPIVRGIEQAEWNRIINDPFWKQLVGKY